MFVGLRQCTGMCHTLLVASMCLARWAACMALGSVGCTDTLSRPEAPAVSSCFPCMQTRGLSHARSSISHALECGRGAGEKA